MSSFTYYKNITTALSWSEKTMNTANINGYHGLKDQCQTITTKMLGLSPVALSDKFFSEAYLNRALSNLELDGKKYSSKFYDGDYDFEGIEEELLYEGADELLKGGLSVLNLKQGQVLALYLEGYKLTEIADMLEVGKSAISNIWGRIKKSLKESDTFMDSFGADFGFGNLASSENYLIKCIDSTL